MDHAIRTLYAESYFREKKEKRKKSGPIQSGLESSSFMPTHDKKETSSRSIFHPHSLLFETDGSNHFEYFEGMDLHTGEYMRIDM